MPAPEQARRDEGLEVGRIRYTCRTVNWRARAVGIRAREGRLREHVINTRRGSEESSKTVSALVHRSPEHRDMNNMGSFHSLDPFMLLLDDISGFFFTSSRSKFVETPELVAATPASPEGHARACRIVSR
jgi:hypothetical protein